ncbi:putative KATNB1-like protein 1 isoform 2 [Scophthalmus maximus]|nr:putative KATNB1-like protein 1 isoform 2 [Scophthalmus maximus]
MDSNSEDGDYQHREGHHDAAQYRVSYPRERNTTDMDYDKNEDFNQKRYSVSRSGNNPGRVKRVVSCKRKTHHLTVARRKQLGSGRVFDAVNKENEMNRLQDTQQEMFDMDPLEFSLNLTKDHGTMTDVLFGRNLRLKVAITLWQRNVDELLTYLLRIRDTGVFVDFLPLISKSIDKDSSRITIGSCVDLFPLVRKVLTKPYEEYLIVGLNWINSVLKKWWEELKASGYNGSSKPVLERNFQVFNRQLLELWLEEPLLKSVPGAAGDMAKIIDSFVSQLT